MAPSGRPSHRWLAAVGLGMLLAWASAPATAQAPAAQGSAPTRLATVTLNAGLYNIQAEVARTPQERAVGLMYRTEMAQHEGMLFIFERADKHCFWMRNTLIPLSIAFLRDDGSVVNIADMQPQSETSHCSQEPVRLALEMNQGWFERRGVKPGTRLRGAPFAGRP